MRTTILALALLGSAGVAVSAAAKGLEIHVASYDELTELRIKTDEMRKLADGSQEPVYVMKHPAPGSVFVNVRLYLANGNNQPFTLTTNDISLTGVGPVIHPFDWFGEDGLRERRGESVEFEPLSTLNLTVEVKRSHLEEATLYVFDGKVGPLADIRAANQGKLQLAQVEANELTELRVQTETYRKNPTSDDVQPVYELRKPASGKTFVNFRVYVGVADGTYRFRREDLRVTAGGESWTPFDWFQENGLREERATVFTVENAALFNFTIEIPAEVLKTGSLKVGNLAGGALVDLLHPGEPR